MNNRDRMSSTSSAVAAATFFVLIASVSAEAQPLRWTLSGAAFGWCYTPSGTCGYGGTAEGYFVVDGDQIVDWSVTVSGPAPFAPFVYDRATSMAISVGYGVPYSEWKTIEFLPPDWYPDQGGRALILDFTQRLNLPGVVSINLQGFHEIIGCGPGTGGCYQFGRTLLSGQASGIPVPRYLPTIDKLDPMSGPLAAGGVVPSCANLGAAMAPVVGAAADGVSLLLLRIHAQSRGEVFTVGLPAGAGNQEGWLRAIGSLADVSVVTTSANCPDGAGGYLAYAVYRAPLDFAWTAAQQSLARRTVQLIAQSPSSNQAAINVEVVRPPVVLVHGFNTTSHDTWKYFAPFDTDTTSVHQVFPADWDEKLSDLGIQVGAVSPPNDGQGFSDVRQSHLGIQSNYPVVAGRVEDAIRKFAAGKNPIGQPVAAVQADVVAHSMGGLLVRYWALQKRYKDPRTDGKGFIHKLITIGTPHLGSPQAILSLEDSAECSRGQMAGQARYAIGTANLLVPSVFGPRQWLEKGAVADLMGDGVGSYLSTPLREIATGYGGVPIAALAGDIGSRKGQLDSNVIALWVYAWCGLRRGDSLAQRYSSSSFDTIFDPTIRVGNGGQGNGRPNDGAVPLSSALLNPTTLTCSTGDCFVGKAHGFGTATFFATGSGASLIHLLDSTGAVAQRVFDLLNTPVSVTTTWTRW